MAHQVDQGERDPAQADLDQDQAHLRKCGVGQRPFRIGVCSRDGRGVDGGAQADHDPHGPCRQR